MTATICSGYVESTVATVDEGCTTNHNTPARRSCYDPAELKIRRHNIMNLKWAATLVIVVGALVAWRAAASKPGRIGHTNLDITARAPLDARGAALAKEIARLHNRLEPGEPPRLGRNLFRFTARHPIPIALAANRAVSEPVAAPPQPALKLIGVAEDTATGGLIRTAIISGPGQVYVVKEGDRVTSRYVVARISSDVVELQDLSKDLDAAADDASLRRLALK
jgi:uncharacterized small protein (DUF1192 family)